MPLKGFTLVEVLLGLAITAIIGVSVYNVFWSGLKLDDKLRRVHDNYLEVLVAKQAMQQDFENALTLDLSHSYPDAVDKMFQGNHREFSFLTVTPHGIKRVRYYSGLVEWGKVTKTIIGQKVSHLSSFQLGQQNLPIEFLLRQEWSLTDWVTNAKVEPVTQIVAASLKKDTFGCSYAAPVKDINVKSSKSIVFEDSWNKPGLPFAVRCNFSLYDDKHPNADLFFSKDFYFAPISHDEQPAQK